MPETFRSPALGKRVSGSAIRNSRFRGHTSSPGTETGESGCVSDTPPSTATRNGNLRSAPSRCPGVPVLRQNVETRIAGSHFGRGAGRIRLTRVAHASSASLEPAVAGAAQPGAEVRTDGGLGYVDLGAAEYRHVVVHESPAIGEEFLPLCHRRAGLLKRWLDGPRKGQSATNTSKNTPSASIAVPPATRGEAPHPVVTLDKVIPEFPSSGPLQMHALVVMLSEALSVIGRSCGVLLGQCHGTEIATAGKVVTLLSPRWPSLVP